MPEHVEKRTEFHADTGQKRCPCIIRTLDLKDAEDACEDNGVVAGGVMITPLLMVVGRCPGRTLTITITARAGVSV